MNSSQDRLIFTALIFSESIWLYVIYSMLGILAGVGNSPIPWGACVILYASSMCCSRGVSFLRINNFVAFVIQAMIGSILVYVTVGYVNIPDQAAFSISWIKGIGEWEYSDGEVGVVLVLGFLFSAFSWLKGGLSSGTDFPLESLSRSFRVGILVLAVGAVVDAFHPSNLGLKFLMLLFFVFSLSGLAVGRIRPSVGSIASRRFWLKVIGLVVALIGGFGVFFSFIRPEILEAIASPITIVIGWIGKVFIYVVVIPIAYLAEYLIKGLLWMFGNPISAEEYVSRQGVSFELGMPARQIAQPGVEDTSSIFAEIFEISIILLGVFLLVSILGFAFSRRVRWLRKPLESDRVISPEKIDPLKDFLRLARGLLPSLSKSSAGSKVFNLPEGINEDTKSVLEYYYRMLDKGKRNGIERTIDSTPTEMVKLLSTVFRYEAVFEITHSFIQVCYGRKEMGTHEAEKVRLFFLDLEPEPEPD